jgi:Flp pilus assembly pilin Flp
MFQNTTRVVTFASAFLSRGLDRHERGAGIVEYILLVIFIALALITALTLFSGALGDAFSDAADSAF